MAANAQLNNVIEAAQQLPHDTAKVSDAERFTDTPRSTGNVTLNKIMQQANGITVAQVIIGGTILNTAVGCAGHAGGVGNAALQAQHADREGRAFTLLLSAIVPGTALYAKMSAPPYAMQGRAVWLYLNGPNVVYLAPTAQEARSHKKMVMALTYSDMPASKQGPSMVLEFWSFLNSQNPNMHANFVIANADLFETWMNGNHSYARVKAIELFNLPAPQQAAQGLVYPALIAAHEIGGGNAHPQAGALDYVAIVQAVHLHFTTGLEARVFVLKGPPTAFLLDEPGLSEPLQGVVPGTTDDDYVFASWRDATSVNMNLIAFAKGAGKGFKTCNNCGGINHFNMKDGQIICPTPQGSVDKELLMEVKYPFGVNPWRFGKGTGKGGGKGGGNKGKGGGKGGKGGGKGGFRGNHWVDYETGAMYALSPVSEPPTNSPTPAVDDVAAGPFAFHVTDDYGDYNDNDGWNDAYEE
jgi:hypothetical protein